MDIPGFRIEDTIHESRANVIYRAVRLADGRRLALKTANTEYPSRPATAELRREHELVRRLADVDRVIDAVDLVPHGHGNVAILMPEFGTSLSRYRAGRDGAALPVARFLPIAIRIARALGEVHARDIVHKDLVPANILLDDADDEVRLIDFGLSSEIGRERETEGFARRLEGSLPYVSPEQTGRMNRDVDYRTDFYSLGVTFFELLTGRLPFVAADILEWVHCHISRLPPSPREIDPTIPAPLAAIVLKLMAKNAEARYQSAYGLVADLERCHRWFAETGSIPPFDLGSDDASRRFQIPQRLYGRERELAEIEALFELVADGRTELCLVSGYSGVGKSALVGEIGKPLVRGRGHLVQGKFDQFRRNEAYAAVAQAFRGLVRQLLAESGERLAGWRDAIRAAVGPNGQLIVDLVPELELVIGPQPPVPQLPLTEAQNRFQMVFVDFVRVFANERHPLVVFLDDLQWSDAPTLNLLQRLVTSREMSHLFVIGAYRSNEVDDGHPLQLAIDELGAKREIRTLPLQPLERTPVAQLVADTLGCAPEACRPLTERLYAQSRGNPFYTNELLKTLHEEGAIAYAPDEGRWTWDMAAVHRAGASDNVVAFMVANLRKLPAETQQALQLAACIGSAFDLRTLAVIHERSRRATSAALLPALKRLVLVPLTESYKFVGQDEGGEDAVEAGADEAALNPSYKFQHDRVQQAAYALIAEDRKQEVHLSVGRLIQQHSGEAELRERVIDVVGHLNRGRALIDDPGERRELVRLNLAAGRRAVLSSAYEAAWGYLEVGAELLAGDAWERDYALALALATERQQCAYLTGRHDEAAALFECLLERARTDLEKAEVLSTRTRQYSTMGMMVESMAAAIRGLRLLGVDISENPSRATIQREIAAVEENLAGRPIASLVDAPALTEPRALISIRLLMEIFPAAFLSGSGNLFPYLVLKSVNLSLRHGNSPESAFAYAAYGMLLCGALDDPALGYEYGKLGVAMNDRFEDIGLKSRVIYVYTMFVHHWSNHWSSMTPWFRRGIETGYQSGDLLYLAYSAQDCIIWDPTLDLESASEQQRKLLAVVKDTGYQDSYDSGSLFLQMQLNFRGLTDGLCSMSDDAFDEERVLAGMRARKFMTGVANYQIYKAEICHFHEEYERALDFVRLQEPMLASSMSLPQLVRFHIVAFLTRAALLPTLGATAAAEARERMDESLRRMERWAAHCPANFLHLQRLMEAELARLAGSTVRAFDLYDAAIEAAHESGFVRDEAMANELAAKHLLGVGKRRAAEGYLRAARNLYDRWGACRKVAQLERRHRHLLAAAAPRARGEGDRDAVEDSTVVESASIDMASVMKASRAISGEIVLDQLWQTTMEILLENAGGQSGCFVLLQDDDRLVVAACGEAAHPEGQEEAAEGGEAAGPAGAATAITAAAVGDAHDEDDDEDGPRLPESIIRSVLRTREPVVLEDASEASQFEADPYIAARRPRSVMCIPMIGRGRFEGAIYLENNLATGVFTEERVEVIKLLSAQAAVSIENAELYAAQLRLTEAQRRFVPSQFIESLDHDDIARVGLGEYVAKEMSVMFADLRDFTPLSERLGPQAVIELLNRYFVALEPQIAAAGGFIDKFAGDEIMALFDVSADRAVEAGVGMWRALTEFNERSAAAGEPALVAGIGVNTGPLLLGTVGGHARIQCTVIGDTVNLASRIEQLTRRYGARFLIGEHTRLSLARPDRFSLRLVDRVAVKGKARPVKLYEVLDAEEPARRAAKEATRVLLELALARYFDRDFAGAVGLLRAARERDASDPVLALHAERAARYAAAPPPDDWQGFESLTSK